MEARRRARPGVTTHAFGRDHTRQRAAEFWMEGEK